MESIKVKGIVVRTVNYGERDRLLTVYTEELGLITVGASGSRTLKSRNLVATEQFCYSTFLLTRRKDKYYAREVDLIEGFFSLRDDVLKIALANYLCEVIARVGTENMPDKELLRLVLNCIYAIASEKAPLYRIKGAFEMRAAAQLGFMPTINECAVCGEEGTDTVLDVMNGAVICGECRREAEIGLSSVPAGEEDGHRQILCCLTEAARAALFYVLSCPVEKLLSFRLEAELDIDSFSQAAETYLLNHLEFGFKGLDFYKQLADSLPPEKET